MKFRLDGRAIVARLEAVERRRWLFDNLGLDPRHAAWFRERAWIRTIHGTTRIEGNSLNELEVEDVLDQRAKALPRKDALEIIDTQAALTFADEIGRDAKTRIDEPVIREVHRRVLADIDPMLTPGAYRKGSNRVADAQGNTIFTTPPSGDVPDLMRQLGLWLRKAPDHPPAAAAAIAHLELVAIHPFYDGNGRTARALSRLILVRHGYALDGLVSLDAYLDHQRRDYFAAIRSAIGRSYEPGYDATPFVGYFLDAIVGAADHVLARIKGLTVLLHRLREDAGRGLIPARMVDGLVYAWINGGIRPSDYMRISAVTGPTASRDLKAAARAGLLRSSGQTRTRRYLPTDRLRRTGPVPVTSYGKPR